MKKGKNISDDFLDIEFFQILQNRFAEEFGIASVITDINGLPLTEPSNFTEFCSIHTRGTTIGFKKCMLCDAYGGIKAKALKKPVVYRCHAGLIDFASPIIIGDKLVGCFLCGQLLAEKPNEEKFRKTAKEIGVDEDIYIEAVKKVKILPYEKIEYAANFLYEISSKISNFSYHQNTGISANNLCRSSIDGFSNFLKDIDIFDLKKSKKDSLFSRIFSTLFKKSFISEKRIYQLDKNIDVCLNELDKISDKVKSTERNFKYFNISHISKKP
jgi:ligand-binding sensor protein